MPIDLMPLAHWPAMLCALLSVMLTSEERQETASYRTPLGHWVGLCLADWVPLRP